MLDREMTLQDFEGDWQLVRCITHARGETASFEGQACWSPADGGLLYRETGQLRIEHHPPLEATQSYFWDTQLNVFFGDGRFFHTVPVLGGITNHWCDPDRYDGQYDFQHWPEFTVNWKVLGPRKDYRMTSIYRRN